MSLCSTGVNSLSRVLDDRGNDTITLQLSQGNSGKRTVNLKSINQNGNGNELVGWNIL